MLVRVALALAALAGAAGSAAAEQMNVESARQFVLGKLFAFNCFEGTRGAGRIYGDGSVAGTIQFAGNGAAHYVVLPAGTIRVKGEAVCASVRGVPFEPCFNLDKTDALSFRGSVAGFGFAYCDFTRRSQRASIAPTTRSPLAIHAAAMADNAGD
jgi:hypothetical protein